MMLERFEALLTRALEAVAIVMMAILVIVIFWSVLGREAFRFSVPWSEEIGAGLLMWMVMLGAAATWSRRRHIVIDVILRKVGLRVRYLLSIFIELASLLLLAVAFKGACSMMQVSANNSTTALKISYSYLYLALVIGLGAMIFFSLLHLGRLFRRGPTMVANDAGNEWSTS
ncbi:MAG TPA: TRAP transporter small permease [Kiloniellales bacterium]|jgi:TRAP-type C4-dicarboxylate transport system permease small subunit|nr:TRAP transporter small permease [Kiloniellales bacterium]